MIISKAFYSFPSLLCFSMIIIDSTSALAMSLSMLIGEEHDECDRLGTLLAAVAITAFFSELLINSFF